MRGQAGFGTLHRPGTRVLTWPNSNTHTTTLSYDHEGENTLVGGGTTLVTTVGYNDMGQLKRLALSNGLSTWYGYQGYEASANNDTFDAKEVTWNWGAAKNFGRLWRVCTATHTNTRCQAAEKDLSLNGQVLDMRHSFDNVGNLVNIRDYVNGNQVQTFAYDHLNRLTSASTNSAGSGQYTHTYAYNTLGNITSYNGTGYGYSSAHKHAVSSAGGVTYSYDNNGNMTLRDAAGTVNDYTHTFNVENELAGVVNNGRTTSFTYDAAGIRVKTVRPGGKTSYFPFPGYEEEVNGSTITRRITYSIAGQAVALRVQIVSGSNTLYYLHTDHLGSMSLATTTGGAVVAGSDARYYPFGDWRTEPTANLTDRGFTGHLHHNIGNAPDDIGLVYMQARWYLPGLARFISADSIIPNPANPQSYNRYSYVGNRPLSFTDPTGHAETPYDLGGGGGFGPIDDRHSSPERELGMMFIRIGLYVAATAAVKEAVDDVLGQAEGVINSTPDLELQPERRREYRTIPDLPGNDENTRILYHYTSKEGLEGILASQQLNPSLGENGDAQWGDGQYFTDISPSNARIGSSYQLSRALFDTPWKQNDVQYYIAVDVSDIVVTPVAPVFSHTYGEKSIYLHSSQVPLDLADKIVSYGPTPFKK